MARAAVWDHHGPYIDLDHEAFAPDDVSRIIAHVAYPLVAPFDEERLRTKLCQLAQYHQFLARAALAPTAASERAYLCELERAARESSRLLPLNELPEGGSPDDIQAEPAFGLWKLLEEPLHQEMQDRLLKERMASVRASEARKNRPSTGGDTGRLAPPQANQSITLEELFGSAYGKDVLILAANISGLIAAAAARVLARMNEATPTDAPGTNERIAIELMRLYSKAFGRKIAFSRPGNGTDVGGPMIRFVTACCTEMGIDLLSSSIARIKQRKFRRAPVQLA